MEQSISSKLRAVEQVLEAKSKVGNADTAADRTEALALHDRAVREFQRLVASDRGSSVSHTITTRQETAMARLTGD